jgi:hypothetical protein
MNQEAKTLDEAISLLKQIVKYSAVDGQKHLDLSVAIAEERYLFQKALMLAQTEVEKGTLKAEELKQRLGLI